MSPTASKIASMLAVMLVGAWSSTYLVMAASSTQLSDPSLVSMVIAGHTIRILGHHKSVIPEPVPAGIKLLVDNQIIIAQGDQVTTNGKVQTIRQGEDIDIWIDEKGAIETKLITRDQTIQANATASSHR